MIKMKEYFDCLYKGTAEDFYVRLSSKLENGEKSFIITANPEAFMFGTTDSQVDEMLKDPEVTVVADGIGLIKGARMAGVDICERIPGVEIAERLFEYGNKLASSVFLFGAKPEVIEKMCGMLAEKYPSLKVVGAENGYIADKPAVFEKIKTARPDIVLVALGIPVQEKLIYEQLSDFDNGIFVGVGGSFDVLSGSKKRAPEFFIKHNIEWLYRILKEPKRIKRFFNNNIKFIIRLKKELRTRGGNIGNE